MFLLRAFAVWLVIIGVETVHGILRTLLLAPLVGDFPARQVAVLTGSALVEVGSDHRLADPEPLEATLRACERALAGRV